MMVRGDSTLNAGDFPYTFFAASMLAMTSILIFIQLTPEAGSEVSGHRRKLPAE
jgi:hypothetical protein